MYHVDIISKGEYRFQVKSREYEFSVDMKGVQGITPTDTLLASLGSCMGIYIGKYLEGAKLTTSGFKISVDAEFSKEPPICFKKIKVSIDLKGAKLDEKRLKAMVEFIKNCPVHNTLKNNPDVEIAIG